MSNAMTISTPSDMTLRVERRFEAPPALVFDAFTVPQLVRRWLTGPEGWTMTLCEIDLRVGGEQRFEMRRQTGAVMRWSGVFREIAVAERLVHSEVFEDDWTGGETLVTNEFLAQAGGTVLVQTILFASPASREKALASAMEVGMEASFARLDRLLAEPDAAGE